MFLLAAGVKAGEAVTEHELLHIDLKRALPDPVIQKIKIEKG
jgi:HSP20 family molecular chaperone IbpA